MDFPVGNKSKCFDFDDILTKNIGLSDFISKWGSII